MSDNDIERRSRLLTVKLSALVRTVLGDSADDLRSEPCPLGASLLSNNVVWVLVDGDASQALGPTCAWVLRQSGSRVPQSINIAVENSSGLLARRAQQFALPISVWRVEGATISPAEIEPHLESVPLADDTQHFVQQIHDAGAEPLVEHGVLVGEVRGLEMCRVVSDDTTGDVRLEVGIGAHDREAFAMVHSDKPTHESIASVVQAVIAQRYVDAPLHPYNTLAAERFMRWRVVQTPELIGLTSLQPIDPPTQRANLKDAVPCVGRGKDAHGNDVVVAFVHGIDLDVIPFAVDAAAREAVETVLIVSRTQDVTSSIRSMAEYARATVNFVALH